MKFETCARCIDSTVALTDTRLVLLPGLDGTGKLFNRFIRASPRGTSCTPIELPARPLSYADLADAIVPDLPAGRLILVAESFSGPLAVALAERVRVAAMIFCNSFVRASRSRAIGWIASPLVGRLPPPPYLVRRYMVGGNADDELVREVIDVVRSVPAGILASRIRAVLGADQRTAFAQNAEPALYLRGTEDGVSRFPAFDLTRFAPADGSVR